MSWACKRMLSYMDGGPFSYASSPLPISALSYFCVIVLVLHLVNLFYFVLINFISMFLHLPPPSLYLLPPFIYQNHSFPRRLLSYLLYFVLIYFSLWFYFSFLFLLLFILFYRLHFLLLHSMFQSYLPSVYLSSYSAAVSYWSTHNHSSGPRDGTVSSSDGGMVSLQAWWKLSAPS